MGRLIDGVWREGTSPSGRTDGAFVRATTGFRNWITADGRPGPSGGGGFRAESGRYHLYVSHACPWAHRATIFRQIKGLTEHITVGVVHPDLLREGWEFREDFPGTTGDNLVGLTYLRDLYLRAKPGVSGRVTVPVLWDRKRETIVSNESAEIIRMFNSAFDGITGNRDDYWPEELRDDIEAVNARVYETINDGVYKAGFATSQPAYEKAAHAVFGSFDWLEEVLSRRRYLLGDRITEADWRLVTTLFRFDIVYHTHFKCNRRFVHQYPNLWAYARELYQWPGISQTVHFDHIVRHYHYSHESINPRRIIPINPVLDWDEPHRRGEMGEGA